MLPLYRRAAFGLLMCLVLLLGWGLPGSSADAATVSAPAPQKPKTQQPSKASPSNPAPAAPAAGTTAPATGTTPAKSPAPAAGTKSPAASPGSTAPAPGANPTPQTNVRQSEVYGDRLDGLQSEVETLKDKIFRSKARLALLKETVFRGMLAGSRVLLAHRNRMGSSFRLVKIVYILDGAQIYARTDDSGGLDQEDELVIFDGNLPPGPHTATIELTYKGHGYGVFSYLSGYTFDSRSTHSFTAPENGALKLTSVGFERGNITTEMRDRPSVDWQNVPLDAAGRPLPTAGRRGK